MIEHPSSPSSTDHAASPITDAAHHALSPTPRIRAFLRDLFDHLGDPLPDEWPHASPRQYASHLRHLRQRLAQLYAFLDRDPTQTRIQRLFARFYAESTAALLALDYQSADAPRIAHPATCERLAQRPPVEVRYDQLYCTPDSTERRVNKILEVTAQSDGRVLFVGDDDLGSIVLSDRFAGDIHVIDLDTRLLDFIATQAPHVHRHKIDLILGGVPRWMLGHFDTVVLDPPWDIGGAWAFLSRALYCLRESPSARILLAFCPIQMELIGAQMRRFWMRLARYGLVCESIDTACHLYDLSPMRTLDYQRAFGLHLPTVESPLFDALREVPYTFAHLYQIRRIEPFRMNWLRKTLFTWWLTHSPNTQPIAESTNPTHTTISPKATPTAESQTIQPLPQPVDALPTAESQTIQPLPQPVDALPTAESKP